MTREGIQSRNLLVYLRDLAVFKYGTDPLRFFRMVSGRRMSEDNGTTYGDPDVWRGHVLRILCEEDIPTALASEAWDLLLRLDELQPPRIVCSNCPG